MDLLVQRSALNAWLGSNAVVRGLLLLKIVKKAPIIAL